MGSKAVLRILLIEVLTPPVAVDLGQYGGGGNRAHQRIPFDDGLCGHVQQRDPVAIHQNQAWLEPQTLHGPAHGQHGGLQNIETIDFLDAGLCNRATQGLGPDLVKQPGPAQGRELLRVVQSHDWLEIIQNDRRRHHGTCQGAAARFIHTGYQPGRIVKKKALFSPEELVRSHERPIRRCYLARTGATR